MALSPTTFAEQTQRLIGHYRPGEPAERFGDWLGEIAAAFMDAARVTDSGFALAVTECIRHREQRGLPLVAELRPLVEVAWLKEQRAHALPAPPVQASRPDPVAFARNVAIGRLRLRYRMALSDQYRQLHGLPPHARAPEDCWRGADEPTAEEVDLFLREMGVNG